MNRNPAIYNNPETGYIISFIGKENHTTLVREGCSGSPLCAMEWYIAKGDNYLSSEALNIHFNDEDLENLYQAIKAVRKERRKLIKAGRDYFTGRTIR